jgi:outer membrane protein
MMGGMFVLLICCQCIRTASAADLMEVYQRALISDPQLREADATRLARRESKPKAIAALLPQLNGSGAANREIDRGHQNVVETVQNVSGGESFVESFPFDGKTVTNKRLFGVDLKQNLFVWEDWVALKRADAEVAEAEADFISIQQGLIMRIAESYFNILAAQDVLDARQSVVASDDLQLDQAEKRYAADLIGIAEVEQARASRKNAVAAIIAAKRTLASTLDILAEYTGEPFESLSRPTDALELAAPNPANEENWVDLALQQNLALVSSRLAADSAREKVSASYGGHMPTLALVASRYKATTGGTYTNTDGSPFGSTTLDQYQNKIGIQFTVPLFSGGLVSAEVHEAVYQHRAAKERVERIARETRRTVRDAYQGVISDISHVKALQEAVEASATALKATETSYGAGTRAAIDLLESRRVWLEAKTEYSRSRYDYLVNSLRLQQAAGTLSMDSIVKLNALLTEVPRHRADES